MSTDKQLSDDEIGEIIAAINRATTGFGGWTWLSFARAVIEADRKLAQGELASRWVIVRESALDVGRGDDVRTGGKPELGYALLAGAGTFENEDAARAALREAQLPLGWVLMPLTRLLPDFAAPQLAQPRGEPVSWSEIEAHLNEYVEGYTLEGVESAEGVEGYYTPNEHERMLILDAVMGLTADDDFLRMVRAAHQVGAAPGSGHQGAPKV